jgi:hypothetical protein
MKIQDLRIGNYIKRNGLNSTVELINGETEDVHFLGKDFYYNENIMYIEPIEITEEWLFSFGFNKSGSTIYKNIGSIEIGTIAKGKRFYIQIGTENVTLNIKYVHQLQNLYFAIGGDELTYENGIK